VVEHRLGGLAPKGVAIFSNSECYIYGEGGSRDYGVSPWSLKGTTLREAKGPKCWLSVNLKGVSILKQSGGRLRSSHPLNNA
jgi:hypothetical protein